MREEFHALQANLFAKDQALAAANQRIAEQSKQIETKDKVIADKEAMLATYVNTISDKDAALAKAQADLMAVNQRVASLTQPTGHHNHVVEHHASMDVVSMVATLALPATQTKTQTSESQSVSQSVQLRLAAAAPAGPKVCRAPPLPLIYCIVLDG